MPTPLTHTPFGNPDGSRSDIHEVVDNFIVFEDLPVTGGLGIRADDLSRRVIVGAKGSGKTVSAEGTYHRVYDSCIPKWLNQAGAKDDFVRLEDVGIHGNMHEMFLDKNSDDVIKFIDGWLRKNINNKSGPATR